MLLPICAFHWDCLTIYTPCATIYAVNLKEPRSTSKYHTLVPPYLTPLAFQIYDYGQQWSMSFDKHWCPISLSKGHTCFSPNIKSTSPIHQGASLTCQLLFFNFCISLLTKGICSDAKFVSDARSSLCHRVKVQRAHIEEQTYGHRTPFFSLNILNFQKSNTIDFQNKYLSTLVHIVTRTPHTIVGSGFDKYHLLSE